MAPVVRSFVVFRDDAPAPPSPADHVDDSLIPIAVAPLPSGPLLVYNPDKENINPLTGLRPSAEKTTKKRKTATVLATKLHVPPPSKKHRESKDSKKRSSSSTTPSVSIKSRPPAEKKSKRTLSSKRGTRRSPSLPRVVEEVETTEQNFDNERRSQAAVDARCYELTVLPLADLSQAYEQTPPPEEVPRNPETKQEQLANELAEVERTSSPALSSASEVAVSSSRAPSPSFSAFSTPERKRIYSAFTFSTPSPSSERYKTLRETSVERFSDIDFQL